MAFGLTSTGFIAPSLEEIGDAIRNTLRSLFGPSLDLSDGSVLGQLVGILAERLADLWDLGEHLNSSMDPDQATGVNLDALCALSGTIRDGARASTVTLTLTGTPLSTVPAGSRAGTALGGVEFVTLADATLGALAAWVPATQYLVGARVTNDGKAYVCIDPGISGTLGGPTTEEETIPDGSVDWRFMGAGAGAVDVDAEALETGPTVALSGTLREIETPVSGWEAVINLLDATVGRDEEADEELRVRRELELAASGATPRDALRAALLQVADVTAVTLFVNDSDVTNGDGMPAKSVEALVQGGDDQDIWDALLANVAAGIKSHGTTAGTALDDQGTAVPVAFSRPVPILIHVVINLIKDPAMYPANGDSAVKETIAAWGDSLPAGRDAVASAISAQCFRVAGVVDVTATFIGTAPAPTSSATVPISLRQRAAYDTSRVTVTSTNGVP